MSDDRRHIPVLEKTVLELLAPRKGETVVDCTLGLGGHASRFLEAVGQDGMLIGIDADEKNLTDAKKKLQSVSQSFRLVHGNFGDIASMDLPKADILFADLGLSSPHIDEAGRGFSFRFEGPLDLRFDTSKGKSAAEMLRDADEKTLVIVLRSYGEIRDIRRLISLILKNPPETTQEMSALVQEAYGWKAPQLLPQVFQALRIWVNDELGALDRLLSFIPSILKEGGRAGIISYHSLEDRPVKHFFKELCAPVKDPVTGKRIDQPEWEIPFPKGVEPSDEESKNNPRARSARIRIIHRLPH